MTRIIIGQRQAGDSEFARWARVCVAIVATMVTAQPVLSAVEQVDLDPLPTEEGIIRYLHAEGGSEFIDRALWLFGETRERERRQGGWIAWRVWLNIIAKCDRMNPEDAYAVYAKVPNLGEPLLLSVLEEQLRWRLPNSDDAQLLWYNRAKTSEDHLLRQKIFYLINKFQVAGVLATAVRGRCVEDYEAIVDDMGVEFFLRFPNARYMDAFHGLMGPAGSRLAGLDKMDRIHRLKPVVWILRYDAIASRSAEVAAYVDAKLENPEATSLEQLAYTMFRFRLGIATDVDDERLDQALASLRDEDPYVLMERSEESLRELIACYKLGLGDIDGYGWKR